MKKLFTLLAVALLAGTLPAIAQADKHERKSPPGEVTTKLNNGATININYSRPYLKGRTIGKDVEPRDGQVWRTGANEATTFETDKAIRINGKELPAGKYALFTLFQDKSVTLIFNKKWDQWGADGYDMADDQMRVQVKRYIQDPPAEQMTFEVKKDGESALLWGDVRVGFKIDPTR